MLTCLHRKLILGFPHAAGMAGGCTAARPCAVAAYIISDRKGMSKVSVTVLCSLSTASLQFRQTF